MGLGQEGIRMTKVVAGEGAGGFNFDNLDFRAYLYGTRTQSTATLIENHGNSVVDSFTGQFQYDSSGQLVDGAVTGFHEETNGGALNFDITGFSAPVAQFLSWVNFGNNEQARAAIMIGSDQMTGSSLGDRMRGYAGADTLEGRDGDDYLRGDEGNDTIVGGSGFDDINGNMGDDTASGGLGNDWVVGGKDQDGLSGEQGDDIVYGNLGSDWCDGGVGNDTVRGGQDDDVVIGGDGADWLSGDRGGDTVTGGAGADVFHTFNDAGIDRVTDFNRAEGDRVQLDPGTSWTMDQVGQDVVITLGAGQSQMILLGVSKAALTGDWIFVQ
jgi:Ca2+-binding RTX toxin-like protein